MLLISLDNINKMKIFDVLIKFYVLLTLNISQVFDDVCSELAMAILQFFQVIYLHLLVLDT